MRIEEAWLAGIIEGEGCIGLRKRPNGKTYVRLRVKMCDEDIVARCASLMGVSYFRHTATEHKQQYVAELQGKRAERLLKRLLPLFGERRSARVREVLSERTGYRREATPLPA